MKEVALNLASAGYRVFPLHEILSSGQCSCGPECGEKNRAKHPRIKGWDSAASSDPFAISDWWDKWPKANVGVLCGDGLWVLDVDPAKGGNASLEALGPLPETFTVTTPTGGRHLYFNAPVELHNTVDGLGPGLDSRGWHGYVVGPGSRRAGGEYRVTTMGSRADMPQKLMDMAKPVPKPVPAPPAAGQDGAARRFSAYLTTMDPSVQGENGSARLMTAACTGVRFGLTQQQLKASLSNGFNERCEPPWSEQELDHVVESAFKKVSDPGSKLVEQPRLKPEPVRRIEQEVNEVKFVEEHVKTMAGCLRILEDDELRRIVLGDSPVRLNEMGQVVQIGERQMTDSDVVNFIVNSERKIKGKKGKNISFGVDMAHQALVTYANAHSFHPVREWLKSIPTSEYGYIDKISDCIGLIGKERELLEKFMIGAVARVMNPGCQMDTMLVLCGKQGTRKSTFLRTLAGSDWFCDTFPELGSKDSYGLLNRYWIVELQEMNQLLRATNETAKSFIGSPVDSFRPPYGKCTVSLPRHCVFAGTTNEPFLTDTTGNRRYWPVEVRNKIDTLKIQSLREYAWSEAYQKYVINTPYWLESDDAAMQILHSKEMLTDPWLEIVNREIMSHLTERLTVARIVQWMGLPISAARTREGRAITRILRQLGYEPTGVVREGGILLRPWERNASAT